VALAQDLLLEVSRVGFFHGNIGKLHVEVEVDFSFGASLPVTGLERHEVGHVQDLAHFYSFLGFIVHQVDMLGVRWHPRFNSSSDIVLVHNIADGHVAVDTRLQALLNSKEITRLLAV